MSIVLVHAESADFIEAQAPTSAQMAEALRAARLAGAADVRGQWVGPAPRVTRTAPLGEFRYSVSWVYALPTVETARVGAPQRSIVDELRANVLRELGHLDDGWTVEVVTYDPTAHGSLAWWKGGAAAQTATRDESPTLLQRMDPENPVGPTAPHTSSFPWLWVAAGGAVLLGAVVWAGTSASRGPLVVVQGTASKSRTR